MMEGDAALLVFAVVSLVANACILLALAVVDFDDGHPADGSSGELRHLVSNAAFALPLVPHALRRHAPPGMGEAAEARSRWLVGYSAAVGTLSCVYHAFAYGRAAVYTDDTLVLLWRSLDWCLSRLTAPVALFAMLSPSALARVASPGEAGWGLRAGVEAVSGGALFAVVLRDASFISLEPFSTRSVTTTIAGGAGALFGLVAVVLAASPARVGAALRGHFGGSRSAAARSLNLVVCIAASAATRAEGDDPEGWVHLAWHCATASTLAAATALLFDETRHLPGGIL